MKLARMLLTGALVFASVAAIVRAEEPRCATCPVAAACQEALAGGDAWLARLPMVGRLFRSGPIVAGPVCCPDAFERIGIDFDIELCPPPPGFAEVLQFTGFGGPCVSGVCCPCAARSATACSNISSCAAETCNVAGCNVSACPTGECGCESCPARHSVQHVDHLIARAQPFIELTELFERIIDLTAEKSAAEAALEAREKADDQFGELLETMIELASENAGLEAKLAAQSEHMKLAEKMIELASENARLKAQVELADARHDLLRDSLEVAVENERLKTRVDELEKQQATATAARPRAPRQR